MVACIVMVGASHFSSRRYFQNSFFSGPLLSAPMPEIRDTLLLARATHLSTFRGNWLVMVLENDSNDSNGAGRLHYYSMISYVRYIQAFTCFGKGINARQQATAIRVLPYKASLKNQNV
jgi:hypothetical protein